MKHKHTGSNGKRTSEHTGENVDDAESFPDKSTPPMANPLDRIKVMIQHYTSKKRKNSRLRCILRAPVTLFSLVSNTHKNASNPYTRNAKRCTAFYRSRAAIKQKLKHTHTCMHACMHAALTNRSSKHLKRKRHYFAKITAPWSS